MSEEVKIHLDSCNKEYTVNRTNLLAIFPNSLLATILEQDPRAQVINLAPSFIDPESMSFLVTLINTCKIPRLIPRKRSWKKIGDYLCIPLLEVLANRLYDDMVCNLPLDIEGLTERYIQILRYAVDTYYPELLKYLFELVPEHPEDPTEFATAIHRKHTYLYPMFLKRPRVLGELRLD